MYRVIIVDDEINICEGLRSFINWEAEGFTVVGTATTGREACRLIEKIGADLVLTDIRMPQMKGYDLISYVKATFPNIIMIVLSGYSSFDYAKEAMNRGAYAYLLKPIQEDELRLWLGKSKEALDQSSQHSQELHKLRAQVATDKITLLKHMLQDVIFGKNAWDKLRDEIKNDMQTVFGFKRYGMLVCDSIDGEHAERVFKYLQKMTDEYTGEYVSFAFSCGRNRTAAFLFSNTDSLTKVRYEAWAAPICNELSTKYFVTIGFSGLYTDPSRLQDAFAQAVQTLQGKMIMGDRRIEAEDGLQDEVIGKLLNTEAHERELMEAIRTGNMSHTLAAIDRIFDAIVQGGCIVPETIYNHCLHLAFAMKQNAVLGGADVEEATVDSCALLSQLKEQNTIKGIVQVMQTQGKNQAEKVRMSRLQQSIAGRIYYYIQQHYQEEISLETLAHEFFLNKSYISYMIKKELGKNFTDYLSEIRIDEAKRLMTDQKWKIYEVGEMVGYKNPRYFARIFERIVGMSPSEYRKKHRV